jgi:SAM-dependent methyltransferase
MTPAKAPPEIFDTHRLTLARKRAAKRPQSFLLERCLEDLSERLLDVNRNFENVLIIGDNVPLEDVLSRLPADKITKLSSCNGVMALPPETDFDLVVSLLRLQSENDLPGAIIQMRQKLQPDGLFLGAVFGGDTLMELRQVFYKTDEALLGGLAPHIYPMASYSQLAGLLSRAGLNQPVVDTDRFTVAYSSLSRMISDLRDLGETNALLSRVPKTLTKTYWSVLEKNYVKHFSRTDGKLLCSFEILWLTGWAPHESQQKPLKPGSATMKLEDALKNTRPNS